ncbi:hypothetical protein E2C01_069711 [Portunus trituberculatus]|uniref:Uncharacterized protein n=1 Tax=Portunus trituberculatus TaxID=210409 RepID=A0A5B7HZM8_PORTR|nr:hypothetical protein [Portunus trituberculatus]
MQEGSQDWVGWVTENENGRDGRSEPAIGVQRRGIGMRCSSDIKQRGKRSQEGVSCLEIEKTRCYTHKTGDKETP